MHSGAHVQLRATQRRAVRLRYDSLFIVHDHGGGFLLPVALTSKIDTPPGGVPPCARCGLIDTARKTIPKVRQELVRYPRCMRCVRALRRHRRDGGESPRDHLGKYSREDFSIVLPIFVRVLARYQRAHQSRIRK